MALKQIADQQYEIPFEETQRTILVDNREVFLRELKPDHFFVFIPEGNTGCHYKLEKLGTSDVLITRHQGDAHTMYAPWTNKSTTCCLGSGPMYFLLMRAAQAVCNERNGKKPTLPVAHEPVAQRAIPKKEVRAQQKPVTTVVHAVFGGLPCPVCRTPLKRGEPCPNCN